MINFKKKYVVNTTPIFVIGSGRSGTHLLGRTFHSNEYTKVFIEEPKFFNQVVQYATGQKKTDKQKSKILNNYQKEFSKIKEEFVLEKTHPNIWLVEDLIKEFPNAKFIGIYRNVYATVASMFKHNGVLSWYDKLPLTEINPFLGINETNINDFKDLPLEVKCAARWVSHTKRLTELAAKFPNEVLVIKYEDFFVDCNNLMSEIKQHVGLKGDLSNEKLKDDSLDKWKNQLESQVIENIDNYLNLHFNQ